MAPLLHGTPDEQTQLMSSRPIHKARESGAAGEATAILPQFLQAPVLVFG